MEKAGISMQRKPSTLIYDPYLGELGGGERVVFAMADIASRIGVVDVFGPEKIQTSRLKKLGINYPAALGVCEVSGYPSLSKQYDIAVFVTNELPPPSYAGANLLLVQFPFNNYSSPLKLREWLVERRNLSTYDQLFTYSRYTSSWITKRWHIRSKVLYPPVELCSASTRVRKKKQILSVGRFFEGEHSKRQDILIDAYMSLSPEIRDEWSLHLVGGVYGVGGKAYFEKISTRAKSGANIFLHPNISAAELKGLYCESTVYWHAAGYKRKSNQPGKAEHFGMTTVEAMSYGCVPMAYKDGGQVEIINDTNGVLWKDISELVAKTQDIINTNKIDSLSRRARFDSLQYSPEIFEEKFRQLIKGKEAA